MFGSSNPFGQSSSSSPFGTQTQSVFGQTNNTSNNPFAPKPFGTSTPFGAQTGSSMFGGTSTGVFGAPKTSSPFGASSQAFGSSTPAFGASSAPAFGSTNSPFGGSSTFGQKSFGLSTPQSSPFGSTTQQSQPAFGNNTFGSTPFGTSNTPAFGASNTPAFGASSTPAFGATNTPAFGATGTPGFGATGTPGFGATNTPGFGATSTPGFGTSSTSAFGSTNTPAFGASNTPSFGASSSPAFGASPTPAFGNSGTAFGNAFGSGGAFGASSTSAFGASSTPAFGASSSPPFNFGSSPAFGQSTSAFGSTSFGSTQSSFGAQCSNPMFGGQSIIGGQQGGSRVMPYAPTTETDSANGGQSTGKLQSISAMTVHKEKSQEELRWEDYQRGDKGGQLPAGQSPGGAGFGATNSQPFGLTSTNQTNPFSSSIATNTFAPTITPNFSSPFSQTPTPSNPFGQTPTTPLNPFGQTPSPSNPFGQTPTTPLNPFGQTPTPSNPFGQTPTPSNPFGKTPTTPSIFGSTSSNTTSVFGSSPSFVTNASQPFGSSVFGSAPAQGQGSTPAFNMGGNFNNNQNTNPGYAQPNTFSTPSTGFTNNFSVTPSLTTITPSFGQTTPAGLPSYQSVQPAQPPSAFGLNNFGQKIQSPIANSTGYSLGLGALSQGGNFGQVSAPTSSVVMSIPFTNPFGTLPSLPQISIAQGGNSPSIQYGISSLPVVDKPAHVRVSPLLTSRHLLQRRVTLPTRKYRPGDDSPKVPFFSYEEENSNTPKADAFFIPRENPRALFIRPVEREKSALPKDGPSPLQENGKSLNGVTNGATHENKNNSETREAPPVKAAEASPVKANQKPNGTHENHAGEKKSSYSSPSGTDIKSLMPKLNHSEYFTEPRIQELAAKERVDSGHCKRVKDFVVGRHGYGSIKFLGETDVCALDLEMLVQFQNREVNVYMDESKKPPVGQGLNKPAVVTLLNIKCMDKKSGKQVTEGPRLDKYKEMLKRKAEEQGAEFVSYDPVNGEWMFKVEHFSSYKLGDEDDE